LTGEVSTVKLGLLGLVSIVLLAALACEDESSKDFAPADCVREPLEVGIITLRVLIDVDHPEVPVKIFEGDFEDDVVVVSDTLKVDTAQYELRPDTDYSAAAEYRVGDGNVIAIDGGRLSLSHTDYQDARCWSVNRLDLDLRLVE
jgi:hypothetical protein